MSNTSIFTQSELSEYVKVLLTDYRIELTNEEDDTESFANGEHEQLAEAVFDVDTSVMTLNNAKDERVGNIHLVNEWNDARKQPTTEIFNYSMSLVGVVAGFDDEE